jgi:hypothetical protein
MLPSTRTGDCFPSGPGSCRLDVRGLAASAGSKRQLPGPDGHVEAWLLLPGVAVQMFEAWLFLLQPLLVGHVFGALDRPYRRTRWCARERLLVGLRGTPSLVRWSGPCKRSLKMHEVPDFPTLSVTKFHSSISQNALEP